MVLGHIRERWRLYAGAGAVVQGAFEEFGDFVEKVEAGRYLAAITRHVLIIFSAPRVLIVAATVGGLVLIFVDAHRHWRRHVERRRAERAAQDE